MCPLAVAAAVVAAAAIYGRGGACGGKVSARSAVDRALGLPYFAVRVACCLFEMLVAVCAVVFKRGLRNVNLWCGLRNVNLWCVHQA